ncbi:hypothetical protein F4821DRAFT_248645 [Hypoxylon rubiginosum]|uniref:Uncharacterized protein n=1 Tax=Hypoxylon rubiginosum TaxID=110542 RepID=A0ACC0CN03_9PEZI|nr:hypothetical protein F4821DRAFT_248645 [Hypoxylon rubiginosum]
MESFDVEGSCSLCGAPSAFGSCKQCKCAYYCSPLCQILDWQIHGLLCAAFSKFKHKKRPSKNHYRAILFPADQEEPRLIWLLCRWHREEGRKRDQYPDVEPFIGTDTFTNIEPIIKGSDSIYVCYRDTFLIDGSHHNKSVAAITATELQLPYNWRGPFIAYGKKGLGLGPAACRDLDMDDFRYVTEFFLSRGIPLELERPAKRSICDRCLVM